MQDLAQKIISIFQYYNTYDNDTSTKIEFWDIVRDIQELIAILENNNPKARKHFIKELKEALEPMCSENNTCPNCFKELEDRKLQESFEYAGAEFKQTTKEGYCKHCGWVEN